MRSPMLLNINGVNAYITILYLICIICSYFNVTSPDHLIATKARSKLFIDQERTTLYRLFRYIGQNLFNAVLIIALLRTRYHSSLDCPDRKLVYCPQSHVLIVKACLDKDNIDFF